jgi:hypothetical protein
MHLFPKCEQRIPSKGIRGYISVMSTFNFFLNKGIIIIIINIQPLGEFGQEPETSQATGIALIRCILGKFLGVVCHCFPPNE